VYLFHGRDRRRVLPECMCKGKGKVHVLATALLTCFFKTRSALQSLQLCNIRETLSAVTLGYSEIMGTCNTPGDTIVTDKKI